GSGWSSTGPCASGGSCRWRSRSGTEWVGKRCAAGGRRWQAPLLLRARLDADQHEQHVAVLGLVRRHDGQELAAARLVGNLAQEGGLDLELHFVSLVGAMIDGDGRHLALDQLELGFLADGDRLARHVAQAHAGQFGVLLAHFLADALQVFAYLAVAVGGQDGDDGYFDFLIVAGGRRWGGRDEHQQSRQEQDNHPHGWRHDLLPQTLGRPLRIGGYRGYSSL